VGAQSGQVFNIPAHVRFAEGLALGIMARHGNDLLTLSRVTVLLPTRRACRTLREAFLRLGDGKPMILPRMLPLGDVDEDALAFVDNTADSLDVPPAISTLARHCLLARAISKIADPTTGETPPVDQALGLAEALAALLDQVQAEGLSFEKLDAMELDLPEHWQRVRSVLNTISNIWPQLLEAVGCVDPMERRVQLMAAQTEAWLASPPDGPIIAAGSTGSHPASAALMAVVANLPQGAVVLPGLDRPLDDESWAAIEPTHPQYGLKNLLAVLGMQRSDVGNWIDPDKAPLRQALMRHVFRPAQTTDVWPGVKIPAEAMDDLYRIDCATVREEATVIALIFRQTLQTPGKTAALVTPDRDLAQRVAEHMQRWGIDIDDSAGVPLGQSPVGRYLRLIADAVIAGLPPVATLAMLRHPLCAVASDHVIADFDTMLARGALPEPGFAEYYRRLDALEDKARLSQDRIEALRGLLGSLQDACGPFWHVVQAGEQDLPTLLHAHLTCAEALATTEESTGAENLWRGEDGEAAQTFCIEALQVTDDLGPVAPSAYATILDSLIASIAVRPRFNSQPRLQILGAMEARMQPADVMILGAMNEGMWPRTPPPDPWMSRGMRAAFGLPVLERRIGLAAHDVMMASGAPELVLTRSEKSGGAPTEPSRWLRRLDAVLSAADGNLVVQQGPWLKWARDLDAAPTVIVPPMPPQPKPPLEARPRELYVTRVETLRRDAYGVYAQYVLKLRALDDREQATSPADLGNMMHDILENFIGNGGKSSDPDALQVLQNMADAALAQHTVPPTLAPFWRARIGRALEWFVSTDAPRWAELDGALVERTGAWSFETKSGRGFTVKAKMDRIDIGRNGEVTVIDYKTGTVPGQKEVKAGYAPQLPLEGAIVRYGKVKDLKSNAISGLEYWQINGSGAGGKHSPLNDVDALVDEAAEGIKALINLYDDPDVPYVPRAVAGYAPTYSDYLVLERLAEWKSSGSEGGME